MIFQQQNMARCGPEDDQPDPSDWKYTKLSGLSEWDTLLRCNICKDYFTAPVLTACSHTFCSYCIRKCDKCPVCRAVIQESALRREPIIADLVESFQKSRALLLELATITTTSPKLESAADTLRDESKDASQKDPESTNTIVEFNVDDISGIRCPICDRRFDDERQCTIHVDVCLKNQEKELYSPGNSKNLSTQDKNKTIHRQDGNMILHKLDQKTDQPALAKLRSKRKGVALTESSSEATRGSRLPKLNFALMKDSSLRQKLIEAEIPHNGNRAQMQARYSEWITLFNANIDAKVSLSKQQLLTRLNSWERANSSNNYSSTKNTKDEFNALLYSSQHDDSFKSLEQLARQNMKKHIADNDSIQTDNISSNLESKRSRTE